MKRTPLSVLDLEGTPCEIAYQLGKKRASRIEKCVDYWNRFIAEKFKGKREIQRNLESEFLKAAEAAPLYLDEIRAMAEGAKVPFKDLFRLNLTELDNYTDKCTTLAFPLKTACGQRILLAHNEDWNPERSDVFVLLARLPEMSYIVLAYDGYLPGLSSGVNSYGLCHAINYLGPKDRHIGLPRIFITRHLVTAQNFQDMLNWIQKHQRAFGQSIHMAQGGQYMNLELSARRYVKRRPRLPTLHTNHYLIPQLSKIQQTPSISSQKRFIIGQNLLKEAAHSSKSIWTLKEAQKISQIILSDRSGLPYAIWREADSEEDKGATVASVFLNTETLTFEVYRKQPIEDSPMILSLPN